MDFRLVHVIEETLLATKYFDHVWQSLELFVVKPAQIEKGHAQHCACKDY